MCIHRFIFKVINMFANERQSQICEIIKNSGAITTMELVEQFSVSIETIRRDLLFLEKNGILQRVHGGAVAVGKMAPFKDLLHRVVENDEQKAELS